KAASFLQSMLITGVLTLILKFGGTLALNGGVSDASGNGGVRSWVKSQTYIKFHLVLVRCASGSAPKPNPAAAATSHFAPRDHPALPNEVRALGHMIPRGQGKQLNIFC